MSQDFFCPECYGKIAAGEAKKGNPKKPYHASCFKKNFPWLVQSQEIVKRLRQFGDDHEHQPSIEAAKEMTRLLEKQEKAPNWLKFQKNIKVIAKKIMSLQQGMPNHMHKQLTDMLKDINKIFKGMSQRNPKVLELAEL